LSIQIDRSNKDFDFLKEPGKVLLLPAKTVDIDLLEAGDDPSKVYVLVLDTRGAK